MQLHRSQPSATGGCWKKESLLLLTKTSVLNSWFRLFHGSELNYMQVFPKTEKFVLFCAASRLRTDVAVVIPLVVWRAVWGVVEERVALLVVTVPEVSYSAVPRVCLGVIVRLIESVRFFLAALGSFLLLGLLGGLFFGLLAALPLHASVLEPDFDLRKGSDGIFSWWIRMIVSNNLLNYLYLPHIFFMH